MEIPKGGNQNPYIEEEQTTQWPNEKGQKDKQRSTKHTHQTKDRVTRTPHKTGGELECSGRVGNSCSTSGTRRVNVFANPVISHEFVIQIFHNGHPSHGGDHTTFAVMASI